MKDSTTALRDMAHYLERKAANLREIADWNEKDDSLSPLMDALSELEAMDSNLQLKILVRKVFREREDRVTHDHRAQKHYLTNRPPE